MFIVKFEQTSDAPFEADKRGNYPYIGEVFAGVAKGTLINGTMFQRQGLKVNTMYACENEFYDYQDPETGEVKPQVSVKVLGEVPLLQYQELRNQLGAGKLIRENAKVNTDATLP